MTGQRLTPCMPPLLPDETIPLGKESGVRYGGTACENLVKQYFLSRQINTSEPNVDNGVDLLIEKPREGWVRGQVKKVVYHNKLDFGMKQRGSGEVYRPRYDFNFQGGSCSAPHLKNGRRQRKIEEIDYFYHVLLTPYRQLVWETPANIVPLRKDKSFIQCKSISLDKSSWIRKRAEINFNDFLIHTFYHPIIFKSYPDFFLQTENTSPLELLFDDES